MIAVNGDFGRRASRLGSRKILFEVDHARASQRFTGDSSGDTSNPSVPTDFDRHQGAGHPHSSLGSIARRVLSVPASAGRLRCRHAPQPAGAVASREAMKITPDPQDFEAVERSRQWNLNIALPRHRVLLAAAEARRRRAQMSYVLLIWMGVTVAPPAVIPGYRDLKSCEEAGGQAAASNFSFLCIPGPDTASLPGGRQ